MDSDSHLVIWVWVSLWSLLTSLLGRPQLRLPVITHFLCGSPLCQKHIRIGPTLIPHRKGNILSYPQADPTVSTVCSEKYDGPNVLRMLCKGTSGAYDILRFWDLGLFSLLMSLQVLPTYDHWGCAQCSGWNIFSFVLLQHCFRILVLKAFLLCVYHPYWGMNSQE